MSASPSRIKVGSLSAFDRIVQCPKTYALSRPLMECNIGTYVASEADRPPGPISLFWPMCTATLQTTVFDVVHMCSERGISAVPIVDENGVVVNLYETVDVIVRILVFLAFNRILCLRDPADLMISFVCVCVMNHNRP